MSRESYYSPRIRRDLVSKLYWGGDADDASGQPEGRGEAWPV